MAVQESIWDAQATLWEAIENLWEAFRRNKQLFNGPRLDQALNAKRRTDVQIPPVFYRTSSPSGPQPKKGSPKSGNVVKCVVTDAHIFFMVAMGSIS